MDQADYIDAERAIFRTAIKEEPEQPPVTFLMIRVLTTEHPIICLKRLALVSPDTTRVIESQDNEASWVLLPTEGVDETIIQETIELAREEERLVEDAPQQVWQLGQPVGQKMRNKLNSFETDTEDYETDSSNESNPQEEEETEG